ncbi:MAG TPA: hypothetical protein VMW60_04300 [Dehalococcoidales bacterium]|nr:hypothetical protein [Dehalococcoidales bacterium]
MPETKPENFEWAVPAELGIPPDPLRLRLDFHHQAVVMTTFQEETVTRKVVSAMDVAHALAGELSFGSGLLPDRTLWWRNTRSGPVIAIYDEPQVRPLALLEDVGTPPRRFMVPLPGLIFLCRPGSPPWVYAVKKKPTKEADTVYKAPLANVFSTGRTCPGTHDFPTRVADIVQSFFTSFFSPTADLHNRSNKFPQNIIRLWAHLDKKKRFPMADLVKHGTVHDLMEMEM